MDGWGFLVFHDDQFATVNVCTHPVAIWFMTRAGIKAEAVVTARGVFKTGLTVKEFDAQDWITAVCPEGHTPNPAFSEQNWDAILKSEYACVRR